MRIFKTNNYLRTKNQVLRDTINDLEYKITCLEDTVKNLKEENSLNVSYIFKLKDEIEYLKLELLNYREVHEIV